MDVRLSLNPYLESDVHFNSGFQDGNLYKIESISVFFSNAFLKELSRTGASLKELDALVYEKYEKPWFRRTETKFNCMSKPATLKN